MSEALLDAPQDAGADTDAEGVAADYLTFALNGEQYGVPILAVREIIALLPLTPVPDAPAAIRGVINLRGRIIPVMDLRKRFRLDGDSTELERACVIVLNVDRGSSKVDTGILVDEVHEVQKIPTAEIQPPADAAAHAASNCIGGLVNDEGGVRILIKPDELLHEIEPVD